MNKVDERKIRPRTSGEIIKLGREFQKGHCSLCRGYDPVNESFLEVRNKGNGNEDCGLYHIAAEGDCWNYTPREDEGENSK